MSYVLLLSKSRLSFDAAELSLSNSSGARPLPAFVHGCFGPGRAFRKSLLRSNVGKTMDGSSGPIVIVPAYTWSVDVHGVCAG